MDYSMVSLCTCTPPCSHTRILYKGRGTGRYCMSPSVSKGVRRLSAGLFGGCSLERHGHLVIEHPHGRLVIEHPPLVTIHTAPLAHSQHQDLPLRLTLMSPVRCLPTRLGLQTPAGAYGKRVAWRLLAGGCRLLAGGWRLLAGQQRQTRILHATTSSHACVAARPNMPVSSSPTSAARAQTRTTEVYNAYNGGVDSRGAITCTLGW